MQNIRKMPKLSVVLLGLLGLLFFARTMLLGQELNLPKALQDFVTLTVGVIIEATPFVLLGIGLAIIVRLYVPDKLFFRYIPKNNLLRRAYLSLLGIFLPVCECGNVPLTRGFIMKGMRPDDAIAFLLAAPIVNPITIATTIAAFGGDKSIVIARVVGGFVIANIVSLVLSKNSSNSLLNTEFAKYCEHDHHHNKKGVMNVIKEFKSESLAMMPPLIVGSAIAGLTQVAIPRSILTSIGGQIVVSVVVMIALALVVSICASVDAFFALSLASTFSPGAIVAFLVFGPMIDIKMLSLMKTVFTKRTLAKITALVFLMTFILGMGVNYVL
jgi:uncharacterized protein